MSPTVKNRKRALLLGSLALAGVLCIYYIFDPAEAGWMPRCLFLTLTGWECPGCGSQRMLHSILHLDLEGAWRANPFFLCALPPLVVMGWVELFRERYPRLHSRVNSTLSVMVWSILLIGWTLFRNLFAA